MERRGFSHRGISLTVWGRSWVEFGFDDYLSRPQSCWLTPLTTMTDSANQQCMHALSSRRHRGLSISTSAIMYGITWINPPPQ